MITKNKSHHVAFRVADYEWKLIQDEAKRRNLSEGQVARAVVLEALAGFDQKQESFLRRFDKQDDLIGLLISITSLGAAAGALPFDTNLKGEEEFREKMRNHLRQSSDLGKNIFEMIKRGKL